MNPIQPALFQSRVIVPGLDWLDETTGILQNRQAARQFLLAAAIQETNLQFRAQMLHGTNNGAGPARGWWQFEQGTIGLLMRHVVTGPRLKLLCDAAWVRFEADDIWRAIEGHDFLAVSVARLLLLSDPHPIPTSEVAAWTCYSDRLWRPGAWHRGAVEDRLALREKWSKSWKTAVETVTEQAP